MRLPYRIPIYNVPVGIQTAQIIIFVLPIRCAVGLQVEHRMLRRIEAYGDDDSVVFCAYARVELVLLHWEGCSSVAVAVMIATAKRNWYLVKISFYYNVQLNLYYGNNSNATASDTNVTVSIRYSCMPHGNYIIACTFRSWKCGSWAQLFQNKKQYIYTMAVNLHGIWLEARWDGAAAKHAKTLNYIQTLVARSFLNKFHLMLRMQL